MTTKLIKKIERKIERATNRVKELNALLDDILRVTIIECGGCHTEHRICNLTYIQTHWYVQPFGCSGGDYWYEGEGQIECPNCKGILRLNKNPEIVKMKRLFKDIKNEYKD